MSAKVRISALAFTAVIAASVGPVYGQMPPFVKPLPGPQGGPASRDCPEFDDARPIYASPAFDTDQLVSIQAATDHAVRAWRTPVFSEAEEKLQVLVVSGPWQAKAAVKAQLHFLCANPSVQAGALLAVWYGLDGRQQPSPQAYQTVDRGTAEPTVSSAQSRSSHDNSTPWVEE